MEITHDQLDEILEDFSSVARATYLDDPLLDVGYAAMDSDALGVPEFTTAIPRVPVALFERHQELWTHPETDGPQQEVWTEHALLGGMERIEYGVHKLPNLDGWVIGDWPRDGGGLQLQQPDGNLFLYGLCPLEPAWISAADSLQRVLVLHGPSLGLRAQHGDEHGDSHASAALTSAKQNGLVTGGLMRWGRARTP